MNETTEVVICLGSSCFSRGNKKIIGMIQDYIRKNRLEDKVLLRGNRCFDNCAKGPVLKIGDKLYYGVDEKNLTGILDDCFNPQP